jgi:hypothetical protein
VTTSGAPAIYTDAKIPEKDTPAIFLSNINWSDESNESLNPFPIPAPHQARASLPPSVGCKSQAARFLQNLANVQQRRHPSQKICPIFFQEKSRRLWK